MDRDANPGYKIDAIVQRVAQENGAEVIRNLRLETTGVSAEYSYVLVSRHGVLIVEIDLWPRAEIRGSSTARRWSARVEGSRRQRFDNPLVANLRRVSALQDCLVAYGVRLPSDYFSDLVVLYDADISHLKIGAVERSRTANGLEFESTLRGHYDFAVNPGTVEPTQVREIASMLRSADTSDRMRDASLPTADELPQRARADLAPVAPRLSQDRYPDVQTIPVKRRSSSAVLLLLLLAVLAVWLFLFDGQQVLTGLLAQVIAPNTQAAPTTQVPVQSADASQLGTAQRILEETSPDTYARVVDLDSPEVLHVEEYTTFTWHFVDAQGEERWISLTLDANGQLKGVTQP